MNNRKIIIKKSIQQKKLTILNIYTPNTKTPKFIKQILKNLQKNLNSHTIIIKNFNTPLSTLNKSTKQKINKNTQKLNSTLHQTNLINIYKTLHPKSTKYTFFSTPHHTYSKINHIIKNKTLLNKYKKTKIITNYLSNHNTIKLKLKIKNLTQNRSTT